MTQEEKIMELDVRRVGLEVDILENDVNHNKLMQKSDLFCSKQEVIRRGIETLMSVVRIEHRDRNNCLYLNETTRNLAESKLVEFIKSLEVPKS